MSRPYRVIFGLLGVFAVFHPTLLGFFHIMQVETGDTRLNNYILEQTYRWLAGGASFWDPPIFHPVKNATAYTDLLLGVAPFYWIWRVLGFAADTSYQLWMIAIALLNYAVGYLFIRRQFKLSELSSATGAFVFAFGSVRIQQLGHAQLQAHFFLVLAVWALCRGFAKPHPKWVAAFFLCVVAQFYSAFYVGWFFCFCMLLALIWALALSRFRALLLTHLKKSGVSWAIGALGFVLALLPLALHYLEVAKGVGYRGFSEAVRYLPLPQSWLNLGESNWFYGPLSKLKLMRRIPEEFEQRIGFGILTSVFAILGLYRNKEKPLLRLFWLVSLTVFVVSLRWPFTDFSLWKAVYYLIPGANALRVISRIAMLLLLPAAVGLALYLEKAQKKKPLALVLFYAIFCMSEQLVTTASFDKIAARAEIDTLAFKIEPQCPAFLYFPLQGESAKFFWEIELDAMWASQKTGIPTLNGYSGNYPPEWPFLELNLKNRRDGESAENALKLWSRQYGLDWKKVCWVRK